MTDAPTAALIVAAGRGTRFGAALPKQYVPLGDSCAFRLTVERFLTHPGIDLVQPVIHADDAALYAQAMAGLSDPRLQAPVTGGETRRASVLRGLEALESLAPGRVLVHDAARPFVPYRVIGDVLDALATSTAAFAALPVVDALWREGEDGGLSPVARDNLWRAQTPQGFHFAPLLSAHRAHAGEAADDVEILRAQGVPVRIVPGHEDAFKITTPDDLERARALVERGGGPGMDRVRF